MKQRWTRREFIGDSLAGAAGGAAILSGCGGGGDNGVDDEGPVDQAPPDSPADEGPDDGQGDDGQPDAPAPEPEGDDGPPDEPDPEPDPDPEDEETPPDEPEPPALAGPTMRPEMWYTCAAWVRSDPSRGVGTRFHLFNPAEVPMALDLHVMNPEGGAVVDAIDWHTLAPGASIHPSLAEILAEADVATPFEGSLWLGAKPESGPTYLGLQAFGIDWSGPSHHLAAVHAMRDFGNSNHDMIWTDMLLPRVVSGPRFETHVALANASGVNGDLTRVARPRIMVLSDDGELLGDKVIEGLPAYGSVLVPISEVIGGAAITSGGLRVQEAEVGLVSVAFIVDKEHGGFVNADHLFDRNFVDCVPFGANNGCSSFLEPF